jgi:hypothetical protein
MALPRVRPPEEEEVEENSTFKKVDDAALAPARHL